jgi:hypothetical protein
MNERVLRQLSDSLNASLERLGEALAVPEDRPLAVDGTIQRSSSPSSCFGRRSGACSPGRGSKPTAPKAVLQQADRLGWLDDEQRWLKLLEDRYLTSHTYREPLALEIFRRIPTHHAALREAVQKLRTVS